MEIKIFIENFSDLFDDTDTSIFTADTEFHNLEEYSSITALSIISMVDEEYNFMLKGDEIKNAVTIQDLFNIVKSKAQ